MSLTRKQKATLKTYLLLLGLSCVLGGIIMFVIWVTSDASAKKYCSGTTLITITTDHGGDTGVAVKEHGC